MTNLKLTADKFKPSQNSIGETLAKSSTILQAQDLYVNLGYRLFYKNE